MASLPWYVPFTAATPTDRVASNSSGPIGLQSLAPRRGAREHAGSVEQGPHAVTRGLEEMASVEGHGSTGHEAEVTYRRPRETVKVLTTGPRPPSRTGRAAGPRARRPRAAIPPSRRSARRGPRRARDLDPVALRPSTRGRQEQEAAAQERHREPSVHHREDRHRHAGNPHHPSLLPFARRQAGGSVCSRRPAPRPSRSPAALPGAPSRAPREPGVPRRRRSGAPPRTPA